MLTHVEISHFRNLTHLSMEADPSCTVITGPNGSGKSSILEALYFLSSGRSFRATQISSLIQYQAESFQIVVKQSEKPQVIGLYKSKEKTVIRLDGVTEKSHVDIAEALPILYFNPERIQQFLSSSKKRRQFLDWGVFYHDPKFLPLWQQMSRLIKQRNAALKKGGADTEIRAWDLHFVQIAESLDRVRQEYLAFFMSQLKNLAGPWLEELQISLSYYRGWPKDRDLLAVLDETRVQDRQNGYTNHGPHRADLRMRLRRATLQDMLSRGQQKMLLCYLNLTAAECFKLHRGVSPLVLIDDLSSELDQNYCKQLIEKLLNCGSQVFLTSIREENLVEYLDRPKVIKLNQG